MALTLYYHPFSSFCQKSTVALRERSVEYEGVIVDLGEPEEKAVLEALWPIGKFPVLRDEEAGITIPEASLIVEYADRFGEAPPLVPADRDEARNVRLWDRLFDNYVEHPMQKAVADHFRPAGARDPHGVAEAKALLERAYEIAEAELARTGAEWIAGEAFSLADCGAAPALFYSNMVVPLAPYPHVSAYFERLLERPSFARAVEEARPYRHFFPLEWTADY
jgi:glutathione S-transferase